MKTESPKWRKYLPDDYHEPQTLELYQKAYRSLQSSIYLNYPRIISFETLARCNASCNFCPYPQRLDIGTIMPDSLVEKIINDMKEIPPSAPFHVTLARINEPFLDKRIFKIANSITTTIPHASLIFFSNGSLLTDRVLDQIGNLQRIYVVNISFNDHRPEKYEETMKIPYQRTVERLDGLHARIADGRLKFGVRVSRVSDGTYADDEFIHFVSERWPRFDVVNYRRADWLGDVSTFSSDIPDAGCHQWFTISLLADGRQTFCCLDSSGKFGTKKNIRDYSLLELYNLPERKELRQKALSRLNYPICKKCSLLG